MNRELVVCLFVCLFDVFISLHAHSFMYTLCVDSLYSYNFVNQSLKI